MMGLLDMDTMSVPDRTTDPDSYTIAVLRDEESDTVTFASSPEGASTVSRTQWITVDSDDLVPLENV